MTDFISNFQRAAKRIFKYQFLPEKWHGLAIGNLPLLAIDFELTSLKRDANIVSGGWVCCNDGRIQLDTAFHAVVKTEADLEQSPTIHGITHREIENGVSLVELMEKLLRFASSHIWVFHNAALDMNAIKFACKALEITLPEITYLDTMILARYLLYKKQQEIGLKALSLLECRRQYGLESINAHNALSDAMATIELVLLQLHEFSPKGVEPLQELSRTKALSVS